MEKLENMKEKLGSMLERLVNNLVTLDCNLEMLDCRLEKLVNILVKLVNIHRHQEHMLVIQAIGVRNQVIVEHTYYLLLVTAYTVNLVTYHHLVTLENGLVSNQVRNWMLVIEMERMLHCQVLLQIHVMV